MRLICDIETMPEFCCVCFTDYDTTKEKVLVIDDVVNELDEIKTFLASTKYLITFNGVHFDSIVLNWMFNQRHVTVKQIYKVAQLIINQDQDYESYKPYSKYKWKTPWVNIDLFLYWSKGSRISKKLSLKYFAVNMNMNVQEMPLHYTRTNLTSEEKDMIMEYNKLDCQVTKSLANRIKDQINMRFDIKRKYGLDAYSFDSPKIASEILLDSYCKKNFDGNSEFWEYKKSIRNQKHEEIIFKNGEYLPHIEFKTKFFKDIFEEIKIAENGFSKTFIFKAQCGHNIKISIGSGGIHSQNLNEIYYDTGNEILTSDVASLYPNLLINNKFIRPDLYDVLEIYENIKKERIIAKKAKDKSTDSILKLVLNALTGLLDSIYTWVYSPGEIMALRLMGQMVLLRLLEECDLKHMKIISLNTDGQEIILKADQKEDYFKIIKTIESEFNLEFEHDNYKLIAYKSVNDYLAITTSGKVKEKGLFISEKVLDGANEFLIIAIALRAYFEFQIPVEKTVREHKNIFDFCTAKKISKNYHITLEGIHQQQLNRFYVSDKGGYLYKSKFRKLTDKEIKEEMLDKEYISEDAKIKIGTKLHVLKDVRIKILNQIPESFPTDIKYEFYINKVNTIINLFEKKQLKLW